MLAGGNTRLIGIVVIAIGHFPSPVWTDGIAPALPAPAIASVVVVVVVD
jgi:hypothetical protein